MSPDGEDVAFVAHTAKLPCRTCELPLRNRQSPMILVLYYFDDLDIQDIGGIRRVRVVTEGSSFREWNVNCFIPDLYLLGADYRDSTDERVRRYVKGFCLSAGQAKLYFQLLSRRFCKFNCKLT